VSTVTQNNIVVGVFDHSEQAHQALQELRLAGFVDAELSVITGSHGTLPHSPAEPTPMAAAEKEKLEHDAASGALIGAGIGSIGALSLAALMVPGFMPLMVGGYLAMLAVGAAGGALAGGLAGSLIGLGLPERHAHEIEQALLAGRTVVSVHTEERQDEAAEILDRNGAEHLDIDTTRDTEDADPSADVALDESAKAELTAANNDTPTEAAHTAHVDFRPEHLIEQDSPLPAGGFTASGGFGGLAHSHDGQRHFHMPGVKTLP